MNICEATCKALKENGTMCRKSVTNEKCEISAIIIPTNSYEACILMICEKGEVKGGCRCWNPTADDLTADDWIVLRDKL